jgi:hypothetical protein
MASAGLITHSPISVFFAVSHRLSCPLQDFRHVTEIRAKQPRGGGAVPRESASRLGSPAAKPLTPVASQVLNPLLRAAVFRVSAGMKPRPGFHQTTPLFPFCRYPR